MQALIKFLTLRNLITPSPARTYSDVSATSLQWGQPCRSSPGASPHRSQRQFPCEAPAEPDLRPFPPPRLSVNPPPGLPAQNAPRRRAGVLAQCHLDLK